MLLRIVLRLTFALAAVACATNFSNAEELSAVAPKIQDFRKEPLVFKEDLLSGKVQPLVDEPFLFNRITEMLRTFSMDRYAQKNLEPSISAKPLTYHAVIRFDVYGNPETNLERHIPQVSASPTENSVEKLGNTYSAIYLEVENDIAAFAKATGFVAEVNPIKANILIHLNLADRIQASKDFSREQMPRYRDRFPPQKLTPELRETMLAMPWTVVSVYHHAPGRTIEGGEIWIQYPVRTYWQESVARAAFDAPELGDALGIGNSRSDIVDLFMPPHLTKLEPLGNSLASVRQNWVGARPAQTLLSAASLPYDDLETSGPPGAGSWAGNVADCSRTEHSRAIGGRLSRALAIFGSGLRYNALILDPISDYAAGFRRDPERFLATISLLGYSDSFDVRLDDAISPIILGQTRMPKYEATMKDVAALIIKNKREEILSAINQVAIDLRVGNDMCLSRDTYKQWVARDTK
jgi:hypothetical protein